MKNGKKYKMRIHVKEEVTYLMPWMIREWFKKVKRKARFYWKQFMEG